MAPILWEPERAEQLAPVATAPSVALGKPQKNGIFFSGPATKTGTWGGVKGRATKKIPFFKTFFYFVPNLR